MKLIRKIISTPALSWPYTGAVARDENTVLREQRIRRYRLIKNCRGKQAVRNSEAVRMRGIMSGASNFGNLIDDARSHAYEVNQLKLE